MNYSCEPAASPANRASPRMRNDPPKNCRDTCGSTVRRSSCGCRRGLSVCARQVGRTFRGRAEKCVTGAFDSLSSRWRRCCRSAGSDVFSSQPQDLSERSTHRTVKTTRRPRAAERRWIVDHGLDEFLGPHHGVRRFMRADRTNPDRAVACPSQLLVASLARVGRLRHRRNWLVAN